MVYLTNRGEDLRELAKSRKVLMVFLRHFGCTFCRETMAELAKVKDEIERDGIVIVVVHMIDSDTASEILNLYDLGDVRHISDRTQMLYNFYGLRKVGFRAMFGFKNWYRAFIAGIVKGHLIGKPAGDPFQMPGVFLLQNNRILNKFTYQYVSDKPNFVEMTRVA